MHVSRLIQVSAVPFVLVVGCLPNPSPGTDVLVSESGTSSSTGETETSTTDSPTNTSVVTSTGTSTEADVSTSMPTSTSTAVCGDAVVDPGEACDDGNEIDDDECSNACVLAACGDGMVQKMEECDDGNQDNTDACLDSCSNAACGDGAVHEEMEACDDGNVDNNDACTNDCKAAVCGDGFVHDLIEACDDKNTNDGDGCSAECLEERWVFVSSVSYKGDFNPLDANPNQLAGIKLADARCKARAEAVGLTGTYKAWLSDDATSPAGRFDTSFTGLYRLVSEGRPIVATGWSDLIAKPLVHAIDADENGAPASGVSVWTNTLSTGLKASSDHCNGWSSNKASHSSSIGESSAIDATWTYFISMQVCSNGIQIYCFQDPL